MKKKKILVVYILGLFLLSVLLISLVNADCYTHVTCAGGGIAWCSAFGEGATCVASGDTVTCSGGGVERSWTCPHVR